MKALCEESRCRILMLLSERAYCVSALAALLELSVPAVSQHLRILRDAGLVTGEKYGYHTHYKINKEKLLALSEDLKGLTEEKPELCEKRSRLCSVSEIIDCKGKGKRKDQ